MVTEQTSDVGVTPAYLMQSPEIVGNVGPPNDMQTFKYCLLY
jgi:hypothetical protein